MENKETLDNKSKEQVWYLRRDALTGFASLVPPLSYLIIILNYKKISPDTRSGALFFTNLMMTFWVIKLLPHNTFTFILLCFMVAFSIFLTVMKFKLMMKD